MKRPRIDTTWNLLSLAVTEIFNPLLLIGTALFVSIGYILTLLMPVNIDIWALLFVACIALPLAFLAVRARQLWRQNQTAAVRFSWRACLPILPLLVLLPPAVAKLWLPSIYTLAHTDLQFPFIMQVFQGTSPFDSVIVPGNPSNQYWLYFVFVAAVVRVSALDIYSAWILVNMAFFFSCPLWIGRTLLALHLASRQTLRLGLLTLFCFAAINLTALLTLSAHILSGAADPNDPSLILLDGADSRIRGIASIVASGRGVTAGFTALTATVYIVVSLLRDSIDRMSLVLASAAGIVSLAFMPLFAVYIVVSVLGALALVALYSFATNGERTDAAAAYLRDVAAKIGPGFLLLWILVSLAMALPLLKYLLEFTTGFRSSIALVLADEVNIRRTLASSLLLLPTACLQIVRGLRSNCRTQWFFAFSAILGIALSVAITSAEDSWYKFQYVLPTQLAMLTLLSLKYGGSGYRVFSSAPRIYVYALVVLALVNAAHYSHGSALGRLAGGQNVRFEGIHVYTTDDFGGRISAFYWMRDNTSHDAIVLVPHVYSVRSKLFHGRLNYVSRGGKGYADHLPGYDQRIEDLHIFYDSRTSSAEYLELLESMQRQLPGRSLYAAVMDPELSRETMAQRGAQLVFENPPYGAHVYLLNPATAS